MGVRNQQGSSPGVSGKHSCRPAPVSKQTREPARLLANIRTTLLQSENWFQADVGNKQGNSSFMKAIRMPAISRGGYKRNRRKKRKQQFLATFRQPTFFYYNIILFCPLCLYPEIKCSSRSINDGLFSIHVNIPY